MPSVPPANSSTVSATHPIVVGNSDTREVTLINTIHVQLLHRTDNLESVLIVADALRSYADKPLHKREMGHTWKILCAVAEVARAAATRREAKVLMAMRMSRWSEGASFVVGQAAFAELLYLDRPPD